jgi:hypothetical protein
MTVPKASMNENGGLVLRQHDIRLSWKVPDMEPEPESNLVQSAAHCFFRSRIRASNAGHHPRTGGFVDDISQFRRLSACRSRREE